MHSHAHPQGHGHHHDHSHGGHDHNPDFRNASFSFVVAVVANLAYTAVEGGYALWADSASLLADAGHNLSDVLGLLLAWGAAYLATRSSSDHYSFGYRKTTILAALTNAIILICASGFIAYESLEKLLNPTPVSEVAIMVVAGIGIVVNAGTAMLFMRDSKTDLNMRGAYLHLAYDALISVGVVISGALMLMTGWLWVDGLAGLLIVIVIVLGTWSLLKDSVDLILDAVPQHIDRQAVHDYLAAIDGVREVHDLHIWAMSTQETSLTAHLVMPENTLWEVEEGYNRIGEALKKKFSIHHVTLQVERDFTCATQDCD
ncbi:MAG: cation diffusion facilitator family transporter [Proteobacteria bacterium]|nr:cation diffusion facilitator family transporter [Pseudomonadota bacterium]